MIVDDVDVESEALHQMPVSKLHERFVSVYGEAPRSRNRVWLIRKILWRLQSLKYGSLSERARLRATELAAYAKMKLFKSPSIQFAHGRKGNAPTKEICSTIANQERTPCKSDSA